MEIKGKMIARISISVILVVIGLLLVPLAAASTAEDINTLPINDTKGNPEKIESVLYQLMKAQKRDDFAEAHGLYLIDDKVRVVIELNNTEVLNREKIIKRYDGTMETYHENLVQALVPVDNLIPLSENPSVIYVRTPLIGYPQQKEIPKFPTSLVVAILVLGIGLMATF
ncbi:MAG TPA: hypothetical protein C5S37_08000, partial [Methanophagales archaeon]|nr:hypothetical protein [Methanophagales archaeon]